MMTQLHLSLRYCLMAARCAALMLSAEETTRDSRVEGSAGEVVDMLQDGRHGQQQHGIVTRSKNASSMLATDQGFVLIQLHLDRSLPA